MGFNWGIKCSDRFCREGAVRESGYPRQVDYFGIGESWRGMLLEQKLENDGSTASDASGETTRLKRFTRWSNERT